MKELINKDVLSPEEALKLDHYFEENIKELLYHKTEDIIRIITKILETLTYSLCKNELEKYILNDTIGIQYFFDVEYIDLYFKYFDLIEHFNFDDFGVGYTIADYFYDDGKMDNALSFYKRAFREGYNLCNLGYYYSLRRYLEMLNKNPVEELIKLISASERDDEYSLDFVNTYLLLIINLDKKDPRYIHYIKEAIDVAMIVVENDYLSGSGLSDTDEERNLCELYSLEFEYYVDNKEYLKAYAIYHELTELIQISGSMRYYHARDLFYRKMLKSMSDDYPELKFFDDIGNNKFKVLAHVDELEQLLNREIELENRTGERFKFTVTSISEDEAVIVPILPLLGLGAPIFTTPILVKSCVYLENKYDY